MSDNVINLGLQRSVPIAEELEALARRVRTGEVQLDRCLIVLVHDGGGDEIVGVLQVGPIGSSAEVVGLLELAKMQVFMEAG
jgi:hypothetical protein